MNESECFIDNKTIEQIYKTLDMFNQNTDEQERNKDEDVIKAEKKIITDDPVEHPSHYTYGSIECIDYITDKQFDFCLGNAVKYITRAGHKKDAIEDLKKAAWYINREIEVLQNANS